MVYTVTLNPSLDCVMGVEKLRQGEVHRAGYQIVQCGGKGINVSLMLTRLGVENTALGFAAGFTGEALLGELARLGVCADFIRLAQGLTRINVKLKGETETEVNGPGPVPDTQAMGQLKEKLRALPDGSVLVLSGSLPAGMPQDTYAGLMSELKGKNLRVVVDTAGEALNCALSFHPFLIKPNAAELGALFGRSAVREYVDIKTCAEVLAGQGARNVLISMAGDGAFLLDEAGRIHLCGAPDGTVRNSVGAGDAMVAGFLAGWLRTGNYESALHWG